ncbi:MAG: CRTAC1 family protein [Pirellulaceae bacterium]
MSSQFYLALALLGAVLAASGCGSESPDVSTQPKPTEPKVNPGAVSANAPSPSAATIKFTDVTASAGVEFTYKNGSKALNRVIVESLGGGQGMIDFDRDGLLDLFHVGGGLYRGPDKKEMGGYPSVLYRNRGDWKFENISEPAAGFAGDHFKHGCTAADYDNDGFQDLIVSGYGGLQFWRNMGDGTFVEAREGALLNDKLWSSSAAFGDFNKDGFLDLYVAHYVNWTWETDRRCPAPQDQKLRESCPPKTFQDLPDTLYMSNGDGTFRDVSQPAGLKPDGKGLAAITGDFDLDGDQDIYVSNDTTDNFLYLNDGTGKFVEDATVRGCAVDQNGVANGSMGVDFGDYNHDGLPDIWVANFEGESFALYENEGSGLFRHASEPLGITALGGLFVGFGTMFVDINRDGFEDLIVNNGHVIYHPLETPVRQLPLILLNRQGAYFDRVRTGDGSYLDSPHLGRGFAIGDLDNDGDYDFGFTNNDEPSALLRNDCTDGNSWLRIRLMGTQSNRDGLGARLILSTDRGELLRFAKSGASYVSQSDNRPLWGFPKGSALNRLKVIWPSGIEQTVELPRAESEIFCREPAN